MLKQSQKLMLMWSLPALMIVGAGCGKGPAGNYNLGVTTTGGQVASNCANNSQVQTNVTESGSTINGSGSNSCFSALNLTGSENNDQLTGVTLNLTIAPQTNTAQSGYYGSGSYSPWGITNPSTVNGQAISCSYTGNLSFSNNTISGTLQSSTSTTQYNGYCPSSVQLNGSES